MPTSSSISNDTAPILWPDLPVEVGTAIFESTFVVTGILGAIVWDILNSVSAEYQILRQFSLTTIIYFLSRSSTLIAFLLFSIANTSQVANCEAIFQSSSIIFILSIATTGLLFFFRVRALYRDNRYIVGFFFLAWMGLVGGSLALKLVEDPKNMTPISGFCPGVYVNSVALVTSASIVPISFDLLVFLAVTWRLFQNAHVTLTLKHGVKVMVFGTFLPAFSKAILQDSQVYFLCNVVLEIITIIGFCNPAGIKAFHSYTGTFVMLHLAVRNLMGCRIYRHMKLQIGRHNIVSTFPSTIAFNAPSATATATQDVEQGDNQEKDDAGEVACKVFKEL